MKGRKKVGIVLVDKCVVVQAHLVKEEYRKTFSSFDYYQTRNGWVNWNKQAIKTNQSMFEVCQNEMCWMKWMAKAVVV
jgi:hypothetical protein